MAYAVYIHCYTLSTHVPRSTPTNAYALVGVLLGTCVLSVYLVCT